MDARLPSNGKQYARERQAVQIANAVDAAGFRTYWGSNAKTQAPDMGDLLLHETDVSWFRSKVRREKPAVLPWRETRAVEGPRCSLSQGHQCGVQRGGALPRVPCQAARLPRARRRPHSQMMRVVSGFAKEKKLICG